MREDLKDLGLYVLGAAYGACAALTAVEEGAGWAIAGVVLGLLSVAYVVAARWGQP